MNNPKSNLDHTEIPIWNSENWLYEDFEVGKRARSIRRTISEDESMMFNALVLDMHPYVADEVFAKEEGIFGKRLVAGAMVFSLGLGLMAHNNIHAFSYGRAEKVWTASSTPFSRDSIWVENPHPLRNYTSSLTSPGSAR